MNYKVYIEDEESQAQVLNEQEVIKFAEQDRLDIGKDIWNFPSPITTFNEAIYYLDTRDIIVEGVN